MIKKTQYRIRMQVVFTRNSPVIYVGLKPMDEFSVKQLHCNRSQ